MSLTTKFQCVAIATLILFVFLQSFFFSLHVASAATVLSDDFTGTTIDTTKWTETDAGGVGGSSGNVRQNNSLTVTGTGTWGQNYLLSASTYTRSFGGLELEADATCGATNSVFGIGYGDPGVLTGGGQSYTMFTQSHLVRFSRQNANTNAENVSTGFSCTDGVPFHVRITIGTSTGASIYINNSGTPAVTLTGGTFNSKGFFLEGLSGTAGTIDNVVISSPVAPGAPTGLSATPASTVVALSWTAPSSNGGATITDYVVQYKLSSEPTTWTTFSDGTSTATSATVTGLTDNLSYDFRVSAVNGLGTGTPSGTATATPVPSAPFAPQSLTASGGRNTKSVLSWSAPSSNGGSAITDYIVEYKLASEPTVWTTFADGTSTATTATVTELTNDVSYNFRVSAVNAVGTGTVSNTATATPMVTFSDTFTGTTIDTTKWVETDPGGTGGTVGNIQQNNTLSITGTGSWGANTLVTTPTYDRALGGLQLEADVTLSSCAGAVIPGIGYGDAGVLTGGGQSYTVYYSTTRLYLSRQNANATAENVITAFTCTANVPFHIRLAIDSTSGASLYINGSASAAATVTGGTFTNKGFFLQSHTGTTIVDNVSISSPNYPDAPAGLGAAPSSGQVYVSWTASAGNGSAITDYIIQYKLSSEPTTWTTFSDGTSTTASATVTGLTNGQSYDFRVYAVNAIGTSSVSSTLTSTPGISVPSAPQTFFATSGGNTQSSLSWEAPLVNGGSSVTDYIVEYKLSSEPTVWTTFNDGVSTATTATVTGLTNGLSYDFRVSAVNAVGVGTASDVVSAVPNTASLTDNFFGTTIDTSKWVESDADGLGGTVGDVQQNGSLSVVPTTASWATQNGLQTVATYDRTSGDVSMQVSVTRSSCGTGIAPVAIGYGDMNFTTVGSEAYILLSNSTSWKLHYWEEGADQVGSPQTLTGLTSCTNGVPIVFKITAYKDGGAGVYVNNSATPSVVISQGTFTNKTFWIGGLNASGTVTYDDVIIWGAAPGPLAPTDLVPTVGSGQVSLAWTPGDTNGSPITDYVIEYRPETTWDWTTFADGTSTAATATVTGLTNGTRYRFRVSGVNALGTGSASSLVGAMPISNTPSLPTANSVTILGTPSVSELLTGSYAFADANGDREGTSLFRWLSADSAGGSYTAITGATGINYTLTSSDLGKYIKFEVTPVEVTDSAAGNAVLSSATSQVIAVTDYVNEILSTGQSLSVGFNASPALSTTQPYSNLMLTGGYGGLGSGTSFTPLIENSVETMSSSMANTMTANDPGNDYDVAVSLHGSNGKTYSQLKKGTTFYNTGMTQVTNTKSASTALGRTSRVIGVTTIHGETDNYNGVTGPTYQGYLEEWQSDYETDVEAITGQTGTIPLFLDQMSSFMAAYAYDPTSQIPIYQLRAAEENPGKIYLVTPKYFFNYSDRHHLTAGSSRWLGEYYGKVIKKVAVDHEAWRPLAPDSVVRNGNVIYANFHVPSGHLVFDTSLVAARTNYGFEYYDTDSSATISSVEILDTDTVKITLSNTPTGSDQRLRYAYTGVVGTQTGGQNVGSAAGNLRDTDPYPSAYGNTLYNWSVHFDEPILLDTQSPVTTDNVDSSWHTNDVTVSLDCRDSSGIDCGNTYYTTDGSTPTTSSSQGTSIVFTGDGERTLKYFSADTVDNREVVKTASNTVRIDQTAPSSVGAPTFGAITSSSITVVKPSVVTETGSGVADWQARRNGATTLTLTPVATTSIADTSLSENTAYTYDVRFDDVAGNTGSFGAGAEIYTLAPLPTNFTASSVTKTTVQLSVDSFSNDTVGLSGYYFSRTGANSGWMQTNTWQDTGLSCAHTYTYSVRYRNGDGTETDPVSLEVTTSSCGSGGGASQGGSSTVATNSVSLLSQLAGTVITGGSIKTISWSSTGSGITNIRLRESFDGGIIWTSLASGLPPSGSYDWSVPSIASYVVMIDVGGYDSAGALLASANSGVFEVTLSPASQGTDSTTIFSSELLKRDEANSLLPSSAAVDALIKSSSSSSVYYIGLDAKRHPFPNESIYFSWYENFDAVTVISDGDLASIPMGTPVLFRPGTYLVKIVSDPRVYAVSPGYILHWIPSEDLANDLYGAAWAQRVRDVDSTYFGHYVMGPDTSSGEYPDGTLLVSSDSETVYYLSGGMKRPFISLDAFAANIFQNRFVLHDSIHDWILDPAGDEITGQEDILYSDQLVAP